MAPPPNPPPAAAPIALSIVIPAFNEAARLPATLATLAAYFAPSPRPVEILVVDDGSSDATASLSLPPPGSPPHLHWRLLHNPGNRGKGYSVRHGMLAARGELLLFTDADLSAPISEWPRLEAALRAGADIAIGSRRRRDLIRTHQSWFRENAGRLFNRIVRLALGLPFADTQCGFKLFTRASALALFPQQRIERWGFDPELLFLARRFGFVVQEVPVVWSHADGAKIRMLRDSLRMFADVVAIRRNAWRGLYQPRRQAAAR
ncbi:MAG TPA: dolichyl-phosphate beta-glucosyltransferase [Terriglobales bacterium]|nr:dolichyl-phosphate beta-glucosyltransferase [Terriglobales bacterium]